MMRQWLEHLFHPVNLWSKLGGHWIQAFKLYETYFWQPFFRPLLAGSPLVAGRIVRICAQCDEEFVGVAPPIFSCSGKAIYVFCSTRCRHKWAHPIRATRHNKQAISDI